MRNVIGTIGIGRGNDMKERTLRLYKNKELILEKDTNLEVKDIIAKVNKEGYDYDKIRITFNSPNKQEMEIGSPKEDVEEKI